jgi:hypothetical protein
MNPNNPDLIKYREAWAVHEALRKLGFTADQIFMHRNPSPDDTLLVVLRHQGKQLATTIGKVPDGWEDEWGEFVRYANDAANEAAMLEIYEASWVRQHYVPLLMALSTKGIRPPFDQE